MAIKYLAGNRLTGSNSDRGGFTTTNLLSGSQWLETDTNDIYHWDGSSWDLVAGGTVAETLTNKTLTGPIIGTALNMAEDATIIFEGATSNANETTLTVVDPTGDRVVSLPNATDTLVGKATTDTFTNKTIVHASGGNSITGLVNASIANSAGIVNSKLAGPSLVISDGSNTSNVALGGTLVLAATSNETTVVESSGTVTIGIVTNPTLSGNVSVSGNLTVSGDTITANVGETLIEDSLLSLATANSANSIDIGWYGKYVSSGTKYAGMFWDAGTGKFYPRTAMTSVPTSTWSGGSVATIVANLEGTVTTAAQGNITSLSASFTGLVASSYLKLVDNAGLRLGSGSGGTNGDTSLYFDGNDLLWSMSGGLTLGLAGGYPSPDNNAVHIWRGSAGSNAAAGGYSALVIEDDADIEFSILSPDANRGQINFKSHTAASHGFIRYFHNSDSPADTMDFGTANNESMRLSGGASPTLQFAGATTISNTGSNHMWINSGNSITLDAAGNTYYIGNSDDTGQTIYIRSNTTSTAGFYFTDGSSSGRLLYNHSSDAGLEFWAAGIKHMTLNGTGRLELGANASYSPVILLNNDNASTASIELNSNTADGGSYGNNQLKFYARSANDRYSAIEFYDTNTHRARIGIDRSTTLFGSGAAVGNLVIGTKDNKAIEFFTTDVSRMAIAGGGGLQITGSESGTNTLAGGGAASITLRNSNATDNTHASIDFHGNANYMTAKIGAQFKDTSDRDTDLFFATRADGGSLTEHMRIDSAGIVGIGAAPTLSATWGYSAGTLQLTGTDAALNFSDPSGGTAGIYHIGAGQLRITLNTGTSSPATVAQFYTNKIIFNQNVGIGTTDMEAWRSSRTIVQLGGTAFIGSTTAQASNNEINIALGAYNDDAWKYKIAGRASLYQQYQGTHYFYTSSASGSADAAISWVNQMTLTAAGNVGIGTTSPSKTLHVKNTSGVAQLRLDYNGAYSEMFFSSNMYFQPSGTTKMSILANGRVGIGTTSPGDLFHIDFGAFGYQILEYDTDQFAGFEWKQGGSDSAWFMYDDRSGHDRFYFMPASGSTGDSIMSLNQTGNVGIGTGATSPAGKLEVSEAAAGNYVLLSTYSDTSSHRSQLTLRKSHHDTQGTAGATGDDEQLGVIRWEAYNAVPGLVNVAGIAVEQDAALSGNQRPPTRMIFSTGDTNDGLPTRMKIDSAGIIDIYAQLVITGSNSSSNLVNASGNPSIKIRNTASSDSSYAAIDFYNNANQLTAKIGAQFVDTSDKDTDLFFMTRADGGTLTERMRINSTGNVGINDTTPTEARLVIKDISAINQNALNVKHQQSPYSTSESRVVVKFEHNPKVATMSTNGELTNVQILSTPNTSTGNDMTGSVVNLKMDWAWTASQYGDIGTGYNIKINPPTVSGTSGTMANFYQLYIGDSTIGTTNNYGIYQVGSAIKNHFGGKVGIGQTNPADPLVVRGPSVGGFTTIARVTTSSYPDGIELGQWSGESAMKIHASNGTESVVIGSYSGTSNANVDIHGINDTTALTFRVKNNSGTTKFSLDNYGAGGSVNYLQWGGAGVEVTSNAGKLYINDNANAKMTIGVSINQGASDDESFAIKSSDVAHGITDHAETDTYFFIRKITGSTGGARLDGLGEAGRGILVAGRIGTAADTTKGTGAEAAVVLQASLKTGTDLTSVGADGNLVAIANHGNNRFIFDAEGSGHADVEWTTYDNYDDLALIVDIEAELLKTESSAGTANRHMLEQTGIIGKDSWHMENGRPRAMVNMTKLSMLHHGALMQAHDRIQALEQKLLAIEGAD